MIRLPLLLVVASLTAIQARADTRYEYNRDIRPILAENCFACHGADSAARKADLRLDRREDAIASGAIVPGKPSESPLVERLDLADPVKRMPPERSHKKLKPEQKAVLKAWVAQGAEYQPHWSFISAKRPPLPAVKRADWVRNPIDRFILAGIESAGLEPAPEADRRTLARRAALDVTGLAANPKWVDEFVNDPSPNAYDKYLDKLFASPSWGEHRGRYWLDVARYADTHGIHFDNYREMWSYRDWVIGAFNKNMPFDQFTIEQLAGDLLPNATLEQRVATGFNRCNITTNEGGAISEEYLVLYTRDRTETASQVFMGLTTGCAVCHDHKFDPISTKDFYAMAAFFNNTTQGAMDGNIQNTPPVIPVPSKGDESAMEQLQGKIAKAKVAVENRKNVSRGEFEIWQAKATPATISGTVSPNGLALSAALTEGKGDKAKFVIAGKDVDIPLTGAAWVAGRDATKALRLNGSTATVPDAGDFDFNQAFSCAAWIKPPVNAGFGPIVARMEKQPDYRGWDFWMQDRRMGMHLINKWPSAGLKVVASAQLPANAWTHVTVTYDGSAKASGVKVYYNGQEQPVTVENDSLAGTTRTKVPLRLGQRDAGEPLANTPVQDLRVYTRKLSLNEAESLGNKLDGILAKAPDKRTTDEKTQLFNWYLGSRDQTYGELKAGLVALEKEEIALRGRGTIAHIMQEKPGDAMAHVLERGEYDRRKDQMKASTPQSLPPMAKNAPRNRLGFAQWLLAAEHPLTARVTVNRFWQEVFGTGIVRTSGDFGITGEQPSHPELLDWVAIEFRENNWDVKKLFRLMLTSATYRQSARATVAKIDKDPSNRLLSRGPRFRLDAEVIRDQALSASGLLVAKIGGPSVKPYQPDGVWEAVAMIGSNTRDYRRDKGENLYRRSMYTFWKRSAPPASMEVLNAPNRETCTVRRERTNTPLQALVTLNDPQFVEAARVLASQVLADKALASDSDRLNALARRVLARDFRADELVILSESLADLRRRYAADPADAEKLSTVGDHPVQGALDRKELASFTMMANLMLNLDEVLNK